MQLAWAGQLMQTYEVPNGNPLLSGTVGQVDTLRGTDPLPYATGVLRSWQLPGVTSDPASVNFWTGTTPGQGPSDPTGGAATGGDQPAWQTLGFGLLAIIIALVVLTVGLNSLARSA